MGIALLLIGLLPLAFLPDFLDQDSDGDDAPPGQPPVDDGTQDGQSGLLDSFFEGPPDGDVVDPEDDPDTEILTPVIEDDVPDTGDEPDPESVLGPVDEIDESTPSDGTEGDVLLPVDQITSDADAIWVNFNDDAGLGYSEIADFQAGQDVLHVLIGPDAIVGQLDLEVLQSESGLDSMVYVEQQLVAVLLDSPEVTVADVIVETGVIAA